MFRTSVAMSAADTVGDTRDTSNPPVTMPPISPLKVKRGSIFQSYPTVRIGEIFRENSDVTTAVSPFVSVVLPMGTGFDGLASAVPRKLEVVAEIWTSR